MLIKKEKQPLSVTHPDLAKEADGWDPKINFSNSAKKLNWKCSKGHKWQQIIRYRTGRGTPGYRSECPICGSLFFKFPELAKEADSSIDFRVVARVAAGKQWEMARKLRFLVKERFDEAEIEFPFPQLTVWKGVEREPGSQ